MTEIRLTIPTKSINLTKKQLIFVSNLFLHGNSEKEFLIKAFLYLSGLKIISPVNKIFGGKHYKHKSIRKPILIETDVLSEMAEKCRFLLNAGEIKPIPWIKFARARHFRLYNATFGEYLMAENYYFAFVQTKKEEHLNNLIAVLYRRPWHRWRENKIQKRGRQFANLNPAVKNSVFMWYVGFRAMLPKRCKNLFSGAQSNTSFNVREYINGMLHQLSNGNITLNNKLLKQPLWSALNELEQRAIDAAQLEKTYAKK